MKHTRDYWVRAARLGELIDEDAEPDDPQYRADQASVRRSVRSLQMRGLVDCRMMDVPVSQRDSQYAETHDIVRNVLVARLTPAGTACLRNLDAP